MLVREITREVQHGLLRDEFEMFYQPIYDVEHPNKIYFESLMRWQHPDKGLLSPNYFLDVVEKNGQIVDMSRLMFKKICEFIVNSRSNGFTINSVSFNVSVNSLRLRDEAHYYINTMKELGVDSSQIVIEITESLFFESNQEIYANLDLFRENKILIAIDDFGMKYSTLSVLEKVKYDMIKLDRHFTMNLGTKNADLVVNMVNDLCRYNDKRCIVEGVEDEKQLEDLKKRGFTEFQGYYYSMPLRENEVENYYLKSFNN
jgi:EAL domain-containing protein (putative c-di-GMP-specific phosphodiesterase class I)